MVRIYSTNNYAPKPEEAVYITGVYAELIDPVDTLKSRAYRIPLNLNRALTDFEERALKQVPFEYELQGSVLWVTSTLETILNEGGAEKLASALKQANTDGEIARQSAVTERRRLVGLAEQIEDKFGIVAYGNK